jgi:FMN reductase
VTETPPASIVVLSGTLHRPSKTDIVLGAVVAAVSERLAGERPPSEVQNFHALDVGHDLVDALGGKQSEALAAQFAAIGAADLLVVGTPVYKAAYTGLLKLYVDFLGQEQLRDTPVLLVATGGADTHALVLEHELRPLFGFFQAHTLPLGVYAAGSDFLPDGGISERLAGSIEAAATSAAAFVTQRRG